MHLAFVTSLVPDGAPSTGYEIANAAIIAALRRQGIRVSVVGYIRPGRQPADPENTIVLGSLDPATDNAPMSTKIRWLATALTAGLTFSSAKLRVLDDAAFEQALASAGNVDGYVLNAVQMTAAYENSLRDKPAIYVAHNVEHVSARENAQAAKGYVQRFLFARESRLLNHIEQRLCHQARFVFTLAEADRHALGADEPGRSAVLPLVTRESPVRPEKGRKIEYDAGLIGTWTWQPNRIGLEWFLNEVVPHLDPGFKVMVAGTMPPDMKSDAPNVRFVGRVESADSFVRAAAVVPLISRAGTGVQLKTIETFELGLPAVATRSSLRGISMIPDNCISADDPAKFAAAMEELAGSRENDVDGSTFFHSQLRGLDESIASGIHALGGVRRRELA